MLTGHRIGIVAASIAVVSACNGDDGSASGGDTSSASESSTSLVETTTGDDAPTSGATGADMGDPANPYPPPGDWPPNSGPGGPAVSFAPDSSSP